jgi:hypothetical protein
MLFAIIVVKNLTKDMAELKKLIIIFVLNLVPPYIITRINYTEVGVLN